MTQTHDVQHFETLGDFWWDPQGPLRTLHHINPCRLAFALECVPLAQQAVLDVGCGGGIFSEALALHGAHVTALDASPKAIEVARAHALQQGLSITYHTSTAEAFLDTHPQPYPVVVCYELLEHVSDPATLLRTLAQLTMPGGSLLLSTLNRNPWSFLQAIVGAEYLLGLVPKGTHDINRFIRPSELAHWSRSAGLQPQRFSGMRYHVLEQRASLCRSLKVNYLVHLKRPADPA